MPLTPTGTPGEHVAGVRYRAWKPWSSLHPTLEIDSPRGVAQTGGRRTQQVVPGEPLRLVDVPHLGGGAAAAPLLAHEPELVARELQDLRHRARHRPGSSATPGAHDERPVRDESDERDATLRFTIQVRNRRQLARVLRAVRRLSEVVRVERA